MAYTCLENKFQALYSRLKNSPKDDFNRSFQLKFYYLLSTQSKLTLVFPSYTNSYKHSMTIHIMYY